MTDKIYMDYAAATQLDAEVLAAMMPYLSDEFANPSSLYGAGRETKLVLENARAQVAKLLGAKPTEIVWTSGGTESVNLAIQGVLRAHPGAHWVTTAIEHEAVLTIREPLSDVGHPVATVPVKPNGIVDMAKFDQAIMDETVLVSVMLANNEIGTLQPVREVGKLVAQVRADRVKRGISLPLYLHSDACQASSYLDLYVTRLGVDLLSLNGSKVYGPKGTGLLYVRTGVELVPLVYGGGQERGRRSGTENVAGAVGLALALSRAQELRHAESERLTNLRDKLTGLILESTPGAILNGDAKHRLPNNLNFTFPGADGQTLVLYLDQAGIQAATGSACTSSDEDPSHVLMAIGRSRDEAASSLRLTLGRLTTDEDIRIVAQALPRIVARVRELRMS